MITITAKFRDVKVKAKAIRKAGHVPCSIYGSRFPEPVHIQTDRREADNLLKQKHEGCVVEIVLEGEAVPVLIKDVSRSTLKNEIEHIDFQALETDRKINSTAKIFLKNRENVPGYVVQTLHEIPYESLPEDIIESVTIDLTALPAGGRVTVGDLGFGENSKIKPLVSPESIVLRLKEAKKSAYVTRTE